MLLFISVYLWFHPSFLVTKESNSSQKWQEHLPQKSTRDAKEYFSLRFLRLFAANRF
jgi:hypothetical protein